MTAIRKKPPTKKIGLAHIILLFGLSALLCGEAYFGYKVHALSVEQEQIKEDYSTSNNVTFGLFSVDQWRDKIVAIVNHQVRDFSVTRAQQRQMQQEIEGQLHGLINKTVKEFTKPQKSIGGKLKKFAFKTVVDPKDLHAQVPGFAKTIIRTVNSPSSIKRLKGIATSKVDQLKKQTFDSTSNAIAAVTKYMYNKYHVANPAQFTNKVNAQLAAIRKTSYNYCYAMLGCVVAALLLWLLLRKQVYLHNTLFVMSILFAFVLLTVGITTAIIEVDARLQTLNFTLLDEKVAFENQELFFQSKSILSIVEILIKQPKADAILVGALILLFVIVLPVLRLLAKGIYILADEKIAEKGFVKYLAFESGKWDMADVMVVGALMTYMGLNGILQSQLSNLNIKNDFLTTVTVNNTSLQPGYFIFAGYVAFAFLLSYILDRTCPVEADPVAEKH